MSFVDYLFVDNTFQFILLAVIVLLAAIVRGCIGFGASALVIASTSFWLEVKYVAAMMIIMEISASVLMLKHVRAEIDYAMLKVLLITGVITSFFGVWMLVALDNTVHQVLLSVYLLIIALLALLKFEFKKPINRQRIIFIGLVAGFYNGLATIGGIFVAAMLTSSKVKIKNIRATLVIYFFVIDAAFFVSAYFRGIYTREVFITGFVMILPLILGIYLGSKLFASLPERVLKNIVLSALIVLSIIGLMKVLLS